MSKTCESCRHSLQRVCTEDGEMIGCKHPRGIQADKSSSGISMVPINLVCGEWSVRGHRTPRSVAPWMRSMS